MNEPQKRRVSTASITGLQLPEWGLVSAPAINTKPTLRLTGHRLNLDGAGWLLATGVIDSLTVACWGQRLDHFGPAHRYRQLFKPRATGTTLGERELLINIRAEDILTGWHSKYYPQPFSFYQQVIDSSGLAPVFMGQLDDSAYVQALKQHFPTARFLPLASSFEDFETIRAAKHIVLSISPFSWLAAWLSESAETIHMPVAGLFNPQLSDTLLLPYGDSRYRFYHVDFPDMSARKTLSVLAWVTQPHTVEALDGAAIRQLLLSGIASHPAAANTSKTAGMGN